MARFAVLAARLAAATTPDPYQLDRPAPGDDSPAWEALRAPTLGPALAYGSAVWAALCAIMRWGKQSARFAQLSKNCLTQVDRIDTYLETLPHLAQVHTPDSRLRTPDD
eukprot:tig00020675_g12701.t1